MTCSICGNGPERCHVCGGPVRECLDGEKWCRHCQRYQRSSQHGWEWYMSDEYLAQVRRFNREWLRSAGDRVRRAG